jgi:hypothetical protein
MTATVTHCRTWLIPLPKAPRQSWHKLGTADNALYEFIIPQVINFSQNGGC